MMLLFIIYTFIAVTIYTQTYKKMNYFSANCPIVHFFNCFALKSNDRKLTSRRKKLKNVSTSGLKKLKTLVESADSKFSIKKRELTNK